MPSVLLLITAIFTGMRFRAQVTISWSVIWKLPSPSTPTTTAPGRPTWAPIAAGTQ